MRTRQRRGSRPKIHLVLVCGDVVVMQVHYCCCFRHPPGLFIHTRHLYVMHVLERSRHMFTLLSRGLLASVSLVLSSFGYVKKGPLVCCGRVVGRRLVGCVGSPVLVKSCFSLTSRHTYIVFDFRVDVSWYFLRVLVRSIRWLRVSSCWERFTRPSAVGRSSNLRQLVVGGGRACALQNAFCFQCGGVVQHKTAVGQRITQQVVRPTLKIIS